MGLVVKHKNILRTNWMKTLTKSSPGGNCVSILLSAATFGDSCIWKLVVPTDAVPVMGTSYPVSRRPNISSTSNSDLVTRMCLFPPTFSRRRSRLKLMRSKEQKLQTVLVCCSNSMLPKEVSNVDTFCSRLMNDTTLAKRVGEHRVTTEDFQY